MNYYPLSQSSRAVYSMFANAAACYYNSSLSLYGTTSSSTSVVLYSVCVFIYFGSGTFHAFFNASARFSTPSMPASTCAILLNSARIEPCVCSSSALPSRAHKSGSYPERVVCFPSSMFLCLEACVF